VTMIWGLPAHALLVHAIVVLAPLTAVLEILCGFWPAARRNLVWLVLALAGVTTVLTPLTTDAGEWLLAQRGQVSPILQEHAERGDWMIYFSVALLIVALALVALQWLEDRSDAPRKAAVAVVAVVALVVGVSSIVTVVRIGHSGAESVWGGGG
jgi:p-aminobenzoyl-glutamate transporter AbgT